MNDFRELRVWQTGMDFVEEIYGITQDFPPKENYVLTSQMCRAAISVPSNIAEGHSREHLKEYLHHISMSQASLAELQTQIEIAGRLKYISKEKVAKMIEQAQFISRQLYALRNALAKKLPSKT